jgi:hypothetical protein
MFKKVIWLAGMVLFINGACKETVQTPQKAVNNKVVEKRVKKENQMEEKEKVVNLESSDIKKVIEKLVGKYGEKSRFRIERGVTQVSGLWQLDKDGDVSVFVKFCQKNFYNDKDKLGDLFKRLQQNLEIVFGHNTKVKLDLTAPVQVAIGKIIHVDKLFAAYAPSAHFIEDMYKIKIGFVVALNFPNYSLVEKNSLGPKWSNIEWAYARMGDVFTSRVPAKVKQAISKVIAKADDYIANYNIYMGKVVDKEFKSSFPEKMKLITHWNLRDELKSQYSNKKTGIDNQKTIYQVMKRIIDQSIPSEVINSGDFQWNPYLNKLYKDKKEVKFKSEPDTRYEYLLNNFLVMKSYDKYSPQYPTYIKRAFNRDLEYSEKEIESLFLTLLTSPEVKKVGALISKRLGRKLLPFDIWYDGFKSRSSISEDKLNKKTSSKYPNAKAFKKDLPKILVKLGFSRKKAAFISSKIDVDPSRGAGHASGAEMKSDNSHLRTRIGKNGMNYKGYNIAIHEFGHNTEQTITIQDIDNYMMHGVPNTAFTEAWAFIFQKRDLELLGMVEKNKNKRHLEALDNIWSSFEIMGVSMVDMKVWRWLYANSNCDKKQLKEAVIRISKEVWNKYFSPVFGLKDSPILAIYSHMIAYPLYLPAYPIGHLAEFQIEEHIKGKNLGKEMLRICSQGRLTPNIWMKKAVGGNLSVQPTLKAVRKALTKIK